MITDLARVDDASLFGGKATHLARAMRAGLPVPAGIAIDWQTLDAAATDPAPLIDAIAAAASLTDGVAVRSSAIGEDGPDATFAGHHATILGVRTRATLATALREVWTSRAGDGARAYRATLLLPPAARMAVVVQAMVPSDVAGVLFTADPVTGEDVRIVEAAWGLGPAVVGGLVTPDRYRMARGGAVLERRAGNKDIALRCPPDGEGIVEEAVESSRIRELALGDARLEALEILTRRCEETFGDGAQDLEFSFSGNTLHLLQRRAVNICN